MRISLPRELALQEREKVGELVAHLAPVDDHVDRPLLEQDSAR